MEGMAWQQQSSGTPSSSLIRKELAVHHHPTFLGGEQGTSVESYIKNFACDVRDLAVYVIPTAFQARPASQEASSQLQTTV
jgi:hypothetical protein